MPLALRTVAQNELTVDRCDSDKVENRVPRPWKSIYAHINTSYVCCGLQTCCM